MFYFNCFKIDIVLYYTLELVPSSVSIKKISQ